MFKLLGLFDVVACERLCIPFDVNKKVDYFRVPQFFFPLNY